MPRFGLILAVTVAFVLLLAGLASPSVSAARSCAPAVSSGSTRTSGGGGLMAGLTLDQLTDRSSLVAVARVESFRACAAGPGAGTVTEVTLAIERPLKGAQAPAARVTVDVPGGHFDGHTMLVGTSPEFAAGERVVVFLRRLPGGRLRATGDFQGKLDVDAAGQVAGLGLSIGQLDAAVAKASQGTLPPAEDPRASSAGALVEPAFVAFAFWDAADMPVPFWVNLDTGRPAQLTAAETQQAWTAAFATWQNGASSNITFQLAGTTTRVSAVDACPGPDGNNDITWGLFDPDHDPNVLAVTLSCISGLGRILDAEIEFDTDQFGPAWRVDGSGACGSGLFDLETVALHETGHFIGLGHPSANGCAGPAPVCPVMNASYTGVLRSLCLDDIGGVDALYGTGVGGLAAAPEIAEPRTGGRHARIVTALAIATATAGAVAATLVVRRRARH